MQVYGGAGMSQDTPLAYLYTLARTLRFADGPDEVHRNAMAKLELGVRLRQRHAQHEAAALHHHHERRFGGQPGRGRLQGLGQLAFEPQRGCGGPVGQGREALAQRPERGARHRGKQHQPAHLFRRAVVHAGLVALGDLLEHGSFQPGHERARDHEHLQVTGVADVGPDAQLPLADVVALRRAPFGPPARAFARGLDDEAFAAPGRREAPAGAMIEVYSWATPNGHKVHIMLEECGLPYRVHAVDIGKGDQFKPDFLAISPNNKIPAIVDPDGPDGQPISLFESGAILLYLAGKTGRFLPADVRGKYEVLQWLMFQMGGVGPMLGQTHHFRIYAPEKIPTRWTATQRSQAPVRRDEQAPGQEQIPRRAAYGIADIAVFPWLRSWKNQGIDWNDFPHLKGWFDEIAARPAVQARCRGAGRLAQAHHRRQGTRDSFRQAAGGTALTHGGIAAVQSPPPRIPRTHCP
jgi:GST-like protein